MAYKLTAYFVVFGIIIGYLTFLFTTFYNGRHFFESFSGTVIKDIDFENIDLSQFNKEHFEKIAGEFMTVLDNETVPIKSVGAYLEKHGSWESFLYENGETKSGTIDLNEQQYLRTAIEDGIAFTNNVFFGKSDITTIYVSIPSPENYGFVVSATIFREGIDVFIKSRAAELGGFGIILIIISFILGKIFASRITRPIAKLAKNAALIARGEQNINLRLCRRDEIGVLSNVLSRMSDDLSERLKAMEIMNRIDKAVLSSVSRNDLLNRVIGFVCEYIEQSTVVMALRNDKGGGFEIVSAVRQNEPAMMLNNPYIPDELLSERTKKLFREPAVFSEDKNLTEVLIKQLKLPKSVKRFFNVPIYLQESYLGSLLVISSDQKPFTEEQQQTLTKLGDQVGIALQSVMAVEDMNSLQIGSIKALSSSIDAKSRWTAGHSERVAELSEQLGVALGMKEQELRRLVISALLHDIGKIGISESILDKPDKLTEEEFTIIKQHPELGYEISKNIPNYEDICDGIRYHHERWNGTGYPAGLGAREIPEFGRIIAIADVFDALTADRPYRKGMTIEQSLTIISEQKEKDFDPEFADKFVRLIESSNKYLQNSGDRIKL